MWLDQTWPLKSVNIFALADLIPAKFLGYMVYICGFLEMFLCTINLVYMYVYRLETPSLKLKKKTRRARLVSVLAPLKLIYRIYANKTQDLISNRKFAF